MLKNIVSYISFYKYFILITTEIANVARLIGMCLNPLSIILEYYENGSLLSYVRRMRAQGNAWSSQEVVMVIKGIAAGMQHLHKQNIVHRYKYLEIIRNLKYFYFN